MPEISIIIPSKKGLTSDLAKSRLAHLCDENNMEIIVTTCPNIAKARNLGLKQSSGDIVVYMDDDVKVSRELFWNSIKFVKKNCNSLVALSGPNAPDLHFNLCTRFVVFRRANFVPFDERLKSRGEDFDWGFKMVENGVTCFLLPYEAVPHFEHSRGWDFNIRLQGHLDACYLLLTYKRLYCHNLISFIKFFARKPVPMSVRIIAFYIQQLHGVKDRLSRIRSN